MENVELEFTDDSLEAIAQKAIKRKTGARGLRSVIEGIMMNVMYDIPSLKNVDKCMITEESVTKKKKPQLVFKEEPAAIS